MLAAVVVLGGVLVRLIGRRAFVPLSDASMATLLERRFPQLDDSLLTAVILCDRPLDAEQCNPDMLAHTCRQAAGRIGDVRLGEVFNPAPLRRSIVAAVLLAATVVLFAALARRFVRHLGSPQPAVLRRALAAQDAAGGRGLRQPGRQGRPRRRFRGDRAGRHGQGNSCPRWSRSATGSKAGRAAARTMNRLGTAGKGDDPFQEYSYTFHGVLAPIRFDVAGGDDACRGLRIEVVDSPTIARDDARLRVPRLHGPHSAHACPSPASCRFPWAPG